MIEIINQEKLKNIDIQILKLLRQYRKQEKQMFFIDIRAAVDFGLFENLNVALIAMEKEIVPRLMEIKCKVKNQVDGTWFIFPLIDKILFLNDGTNSCIVTLNINVHSEKILESLYL